MSKQQITQQESSAQSNFIIKVQFGGKVYQGRCDILPIRFQDKIRGLLYFNNTVVGDVGIFSTSDFAILEAEAEKALLQYIMELKAQKQI